MRIKKYKKIFIVICIVICIVVMIISDIRWWWLGWDWKLPETLINSVSMEAMVSNFDRIKENGYREGEIIPGFLGVDKGYWLIKTENPDILLIQIEDGDSEAAESKVKYMSHSERNATSVSSYEANGSYDSDDYRFAHTVVLRNNKGLIYMRYYSNYLIQGQRKAKDNLEAFIQTYCQDN